ncbi:hypothetical protein CPC08DRAFT_712198 [Agrocybe pediades]|nr:hypothetical protein CPC08DRAFT_712198 [Agrocybe pediades]
MPDVTLFPALVPRGLYVVLSFTMTANQQVWSLYYHEGSIPSPFLNTPIERGQRHTVLVDHYNRWRVQHNALYSMTTTSHMVIGCLHLGTIDPQHVQDLPGHLAHFDTDVNNAIGQDPRESWALRVIERLIRYQIIRLVNQAPPNFMNHIQAEIRQFSVFALGQTNGERIPRPVRHCRLFA